MVASGAGLVLLGPTGLQQSDAALEQPPFPGHSADSRTKQSSGACLLLLKLWPEGQLLVWHTSTHLLRCSLALKAGGQYFKNYLFWGCVGSLWLYAGFL